VDVETWFQDTDRIGARVFLKMPLRIAVPLLWSQPARRRSGGPNRLI